MLASSRSMIRQSARSSRAVSHIETLTKSVNMFFAMRFSDFRKCGTCGSTFSSESEFAFHQCRPSDYRPIPSDGKWSSNRFVNPQKYNVTKYGFGLFLSLVILCFCSCLWIFVFCFCTAEISQKTSVFTLRNMWELHLCCVTPLAQVLSWAWVVQNILCVMYKLCDKRQIVW